MKRASALLAAAAIAVTAAEPPKGPGKPPPADPKKEKTFAGVVVAGKTLQPAAEIGFGWTWTLDAGAFGCGEPIIADARGQFEKVLPWKGERTVFVADKAHKLGCAVELKEADIAKPVTFKLVPLVRVRAAVTSRDPQFTTAGVRIEVRLEGAGRIGSATATDTGLAILVPPGEYKLRFASDGWQPREARFIVPPGKAEFSAPAVELMPSLLASRKGEVLPEWRIADGIGLTKDAKLASFRGRWVLLWFWRHGCPSCRGWGIPNLVKFHDRHAAWSERLQIVAFHNKDAKSAADLRDLLARESGLEWDPVTLPFPIVIDAADSSTIEEWGPGVFPSVALIDGEGRLQTSGTLEEVEKWLEQEFAEAK